MQDRLEALAAKAREEIGRVSDAAGLEALRVRYLGKKGELSGVLGGMGKLPPDERAGCGSRQPGEGRARDAADGRTLRLGQAALEAELKAPPLDVTLPGRGRRSGHRHPVSQTLDDMSRTFERLGFARCRARDRARLYNFEALNFPTDHPARDMQDTFFVDGVLVADVLRTHTSPVQIRTMLKQQPPVRIMVPGRVYRATPTPPTPRCSTRSRG